MSSANANSDKPQPARKPDRNMLSINPLRACWGFDLVKPDRPILMKSQVRDVVRLKSGGPKMVVDHVVYFSDDIVSIHCVWFIDKREEASFSPAMLEAAHPITPTQRESGFPTPPPPGWGTRQDSDYLSTKIQHSWYITDYGPARPDLISADIHSFPVLCSRAGRHIASHSSTLEQTSGIKANGRSSLTV